MLGLSQIFAVALIVALGPSAVPPQPSLPPVTPLPVSPPPVSPPPVSQLPLYVVVPFGEPGDTDPILRDSTRKFSEDLADLGVRAALGIPTDAVEAVANARLICTQYHANGILVSELRFAQTKGFNAPQFAAGFIPYIGGVISGAGPLDRTSIHAQYKLFLVSCWGKVVWRTTTTAEKVHHGANVAAGLSDISFKAVEQAADQFAARRAQAR